MTAVEAAAGDARPAARRFRKRPVVIEAVQYDGTNITALRGWTMDVTWSDTHDTWAVRTLEGDMRLDVGDWVIRGVHGEHYPCKAEIFDKTYEPVGED